MSKDGKTEGGKVERWEWTHLHRPPVYFHICGVLNVWFIGVLNVWFICISFEVAMVQ
jgi:hypothetical protein